MRRLRYAVVGCGGAALDVARALDEIGEADIVAAFDANRERAEELAAERRARVHDTLEAALADASVDVVYIALPHDRLAPTSAAALRAGRNVIIEKPAATNARDAADLARLADSLDLVAGVMFEFRASAPVVEARRILSAGKLGAVVAVRVSTVIDKPPEYWWSGPTGLVVDSWRASRRRAGGGVVLMNSIHQLDAVRFMTGLEFTRASGEIATFTKGVEVEDTAGAVLRLSNGAVCTVAAAAHSRGARGEETITIDCAGGRLDLPDPYGSGHLRVFGGGAAGWTESRAQAHASHGTFLSAFTSALQRGTPPPATPWDATAALAAVEAIYTSAQTAVAVEVERYSR